MEMNKVGVRGAPQSPHHSLDLFFYSTPSSPRFSSTYNHFERYENENESESESERVPFSRVPFSWELTPGIPKSTKPEPEPEPEPVVDKDNEFDFSGQLDMMLPPSLSSADQLFDAGKIRPLKPPPRLIPSPLCSPKSPHSNFRSPKQRSSSKPNFQIDDPFEAALHSSCSTNPPQLRGRDPNNNKIGMKWGSSRKGISRSLSPLRVSEFALLRQEEEEELNTSSSRGGSKKWRLKDLFLFRSASEGTSRGKKYSFLSRRNSMESDENKSSSFRSCASGSGGSGSGSISKRRGGGETVKKISAHERHYTSKKAVSEELKKKTSLAYRHGLLGCLGFNPILHHFPNAFSS